MAPSSSLAQDTCLSRMQHGFESRRGHKLIRSPSALVHILSPRLMRPARTTGGSGASRREDTSPCCRAFSPPSATARRSMPAPLELATSRPRSVRRLARCSSASRRQRLLAMVGNRDGPRDAQLAIDRVLPSSDHGPAVALRVGASSRRRRGASRAGSRGVPRGRAGDEVLADLLPYPLVEIRQRLRHHPSLTEEFRRP